MGRLNSTSQPGYDVVQAFEPVLDSGGLMHNWPTKEAHPDGSIIIDAHGCGNALLYSSHAAICLWNNCTRGAPVWRPFYKTMEAGIQRCKMAPATGTGLYRRHWKFYEQDQEGWDDYVGICTFSSFGDGRLAREIVDAGVNGRLVSTSLRTLIPNSKWTNWIKALLPNFILDRTKPRLMRWYFPNFPEYMLLFNYRAWLGRYPALIHHARRCGGLESPWYLRWWWAVSIATAGLFAKEGHDSWILSWNMSMARREFSWLERKAIKIFNFRLAVKWGQIKPLRKLFIQYFRWTHPLSEFVDEKKYPIA